MTIYCIFSNKYVPLAPAEFICGFTSLEKLIEAFALIPDVAHEAMKLAMYEIELDRDKDNKQPAMKRMKFDDPRFVEAAKSLASRGRNCS